MWTRQSVKNLVRVSESEENRNGMYRMDRNERTFPVEEKVIEEIRSSINGDLLTNYPNIEGLYAKMSGYLGVDKDNLLFHTGSDLVIKSIFETFVEQGDRVLLHAPSYAMYTVYAEMFQADVISQGYNEKSEFDLNAYIQKIAEKTPKIVVLENPNGFIGNGYSCHAVEKLVETAKRCGSLAVIDEAYIEFIDESALDLTARYRNLIIVRTMSKAWGIAGLRVGYAISCRENIAEMMKVKPMHQLTGFSVRTAEILLDHADMMLRYVEQTKESGSRFIEQMKQREIETADSRANFVTVKLGAKIDVEKFRETAKSNKFLLRRPFRERELSQWVRIGILPAKQMDDFVGLLDKFMEEK